MYAIVFTIVVLLATNGMALVHAQSSGSEAVSGQLTVFATTSLNDAFNDIKAQYEATHPGVTVVLNIGGSKDLQTQIKQGANADVFVPANRLIMDQLVSDGYVDRSAVKDFVGNRMALIVPKSNPGRISSLSDLARPGVKLVFCSKNVPCGEYTQQVLDRVMQTSGYGNDYKTKVMSNAIYQTPDLNDVVAKVAQGKADAAIVYVSDVPKAMKDKVTKISLPDSVNVAVVFPIGVLKDTKSPALAHSFIDYVLSPDGRAILNKYGFTDIGARQFAPVTGMAPQPQPVPA